MNLHIDHREKNVIDTIKSEFNKPFTYANSDVSLNFTTLDIGDYMISTDITATDVTVDPTKSGVAVVCIIERKTLVDYGQSLVDGRSTNIEKLLALRETTNCMIQYVVEGEINPGLTETFGGVSYSAILANMTDISIVHGIHIIRTKNKIKTAEHLKLMCERFCSVYPKIQNKFTGSSSINEIVKQSKPTQAELDKFQLLMIWENLLSKSNKINPKPLSTAKSSILANRWTLQDWIQGNIDEDEVAAIKINNRRLESRQIEKLGSKLRLDDQKKLLACIKGITPTTADIIIDQSPLCEFLINKEAKNIIINSDKGTKLGNARVGKIITFCNMKV